ncbi:methyl-accepting chemotaxis protein [Kiloniella sp. b19]|uniref:methyl-accepting chemotaxis protein n=1 Tax=Kiloniella sp. GXU_MW_B19 TaxID=3141326 RepID=UPI0031D72EA3
MLSRFKISVKLPVLITLMVTLSVFALGFATFLSSSSSLESIAKERLVSLAETRSEFLQKELRTIENQLTTATKAKAVWGGLNSFSRGFDGIVRQGTDVEAYLKKAYIQDNPNPAGERHLMDGVDGSSESYDRFHKIFHAPFRSIAEENLYDDVLLVDTKGNVIYSVYKNNDLGVNLTQGEWAQTGLAEVYNRIVENPQEGQVAFADFTSYPGKDGEAESFIGVPVFAANKFRGILVAEMPKRRLNEIIANIVGLGEQGQAILVGADNLLRTNTRFTPEGESQVLQPALDSEAVSKGLAGETGVLWETRADGSDYLMSYQPIDFHGTRWALVLDIAGDEALASVIDLEITVLIVGAVVLLVAVVLGLLFSRSIVVPLSRSSREMLALAEGDKSFEISGEDRLDEVGDIARALAVFKASAIKQDEMAEKEKEMLAFRENRTRAIERLISEFEQSSGELLEEVTGSATKMTATSDQLLQSAEDTSLRSHAVAAAAEEASANVQTVASAAEELSSSIEEINRQVRESNTIAEAAVTEVNENVQTIRKLEDSSNRIGEVVQLISEIAEQTNLLALNATIEAARAGEAGKGFAVVASEVKNLANQTAKATEEISGQVHEIQQVTKGAVTAIEGVGETVHKMSEISASVALSVEQQGAATSEISRSVQEASAGTSEVTTNIHSVNEASSQTDTAARSVSEVAVEVSDRATNIRELVGKFSSDIKAI